jgi:hypothetical protein
MMLTNVLLQKPKLPLARVKTFRNATKFLRLFLLNVKLLLANFSTISRRPIKYRHFQIVHARNLVVFLNVLTRKNGSHCFGG